MAGIIQDSNKVSGVPQSASKHVAMSTCFDIVRPDVSDGFVGFINQVSVTNTRTVTQIRHLNSVDAGIAVDTVVTPDAPTLSFNGFYIYAGKDSSILSGTGVIGRSGEDAKGVGPSIGRIAGIDLLMSLDQQNIPFDIVVRHVYPSADKIHSAPGFGVDNSRQANNGTIIGVYKACTISNMSIPIVVGTAAVSDTGSISVGYISSNTSSSE